MFKNVQSSLLRGYRVLDASRILVGAHCSLMLADMGADVIKIEQRVTGDETRHWGPPFRGPSEDQKDATYFMSVNRNKRSMTVDLKQPDGKQIVKDLLTQSDVFIENFMPSKIRKLELDYPSVKEVNDSLIYASVSGYP